MKKRMEAKKDILSLDSTPEFLTLRRALTEISKTPNLSTGSAGKEKYYYRNVFSATDKIDFGFTAEQLIGATSMKQQVRKKR